jgi:hypothetical protein
LDSVVCRPCDLFRFAIFQNAASVIVAHNHPSGDPTPSEADISITRTIASVGAFLQIPLKDHIIMGRVREGRPRDYVSLRELGYLYSVTPSAPTGQSVEGKGHHDLESIVNETAAVIDLMENRLVAMVEDSHCRGGSIACGIIRICSGVSQRLQACYDEIHKEWTAVTRPNATPASAPSLLPACAAEVSPTDSNGGAH